MSGVGESQQQNQPLDDSAPLEGHAEVLENLPVVMMPMKFNIHGLPVGLDSGKPAVKLGGLIRSQIPIRYKTWPELPQPRKEVVWEDMKNAYNFSDEQKKAQLKKAGAAWRKYKGSLRIKYLKGADVQLWIEAIPRKKARPEDWYRFCLNEATPEQLALRARNQKIKKRLC